MTESDAILLQALREYSAGQVIPMHMPGHKRNSKMADYLELLGARYDITEIEGFDNLHGANGLLARSMERAAKLWNSRASFFLVNGSTCGILAGIRTLTRYGSRILMARNCHKSVYHAVELCGLDPVFLVPPIEQQFGIHGSIQPEEVERALNAHPDIGLVVLTSPTYEGVISDISSICRIARKKGIPVMVDEAHGAHLGFSGYFSGGAVEAGADLVIQSLHKTLPSLTQTAIAHINSNLVNKTEFTRQLAIFETTSPSYLLMSSMDCCVQLLQSNGTALFRQWEQELDEFHQRTKKLNRLRVLCYGQDRIKRHPQMFGFDPSKLVISTRKTALTGAELMERLRRDFSIELEMASGDYAIAMTGLGDELQWTSMLADALFEIDRTCGLAAELQGELTMPPVPERVCGIAQALSGKKCCLPPEEAAGQISGEYIWAYPPGIPLIVPGERISKELIFTCKELERRGIQINSTYGRVPYTYETMAEA